MSENLIDLSDFQPDDTSVRLWRVMDFPKFVSMLQKRSLHFARLDQFEDPLEGQFTDLQARTIEYIGGTAVSEQLRAFRSSVLVNCWHMNERPSFPVWRLYGKSDLCVGVSTTYTKLHDQILGGQKVLDPRRRSAGFVFRPL